MRFGSECMNVCVNIYVMLYNEWIFACACLCKWSVRIHFSLVNENLYLWAVVSYRLFYVKVKQCMTINDHIPSSRHCHCIDLGNTNRLVFRLWLKLIQGSKDVYSPATFKFKYVSEFFLDTFYWALSNPLQFFLA